MPGRASRRLAAPYDGNPVIRGISQTAGAAATDEPFVPLDRRPTSSSRTVARTVNQVAELQAGGYTDAAEMLTLRAAIADYAQWSTTPLDYTMNTFHLFDSGNELNDPTSRSPSCSRRAIRAGWSSPAITP